MWDDRGQNPYKTLFERKEAEGRAWYRAMPDVGWYTYHEAGTKLRGFPNPTVAADPRSNWGERLIRFAEKEFEIDLIVAGDNLANPATT